MHLHYAKVIVNTIVHSCTWKLALRGTDSKTEDKKVSKNMTYMEHSKQGGEELLMTCRLRVVVPVGIHFYVSQSLIVNSGACNIT